MSIKLNQLFISGQKNPYLPELFGNKVSEFLNYNNTTHYLICDPHPLEDMICQQARTGQEVWIKVVSATTAINDYEFVAAFDYCSIYKTDTPNWNIPGAQYSFTEFKD